MKILNRIPDLKLNLFAVNVHHSCPELNTDGQIMDRLKSFVSELEQKTALA
jgi:hypothetical protein